LLVFTSIVFSLRVAIWAKQPQVTNAVVIINTVEMMKLWWDGLAAPFYQAAMLTLVLLPTLLEQSDPQSMRECIN